MLMSKQIEELQKVLEDKYGAHVSDYSVVVDHEDLGYSETAFWYSIENFIKQKDSQNNLLVIFYSGCSYVHEGQLFLEPYRHTEPTVPWPHAPDQRIFSCKSNVLWLFDTMCL